MEKGIPLRVFFPEPPALCMEPATKLRFISIVKSAKKDGYLDVKYPEAFIKSLIDEGLKSEGNTASLECLQEWIRETKKITDELNIKSGFGTGTPSSPAK
ncbi:MAG: hypothetical protein WAW10_01745 [Gallionella sp.]